MFMQRFAMRGKAGLLRIMPPFLWAGVEMKSPKSRGLRPIVAERVLSTDSGKQVEVRLGKPARAANRWRCPFQIVGLYDDQVFSGVGIDSFQALYSALEGIRTKIGESRLRLYVPGTEPPYLGFPMFIPEFLGLDVYEKLEKVVLDRMERTAREAKLTFDRRIRRGSRGRKR
jgi:hypothetical protein